MQEEAAELCWWKLEVILKGVVWQLGPRRIFSGLCDDDWKKAIRGGASIQSLVKRLDREQAE